MIKYLHIGSMFLFGMGVAYAQVGLPWPGPGAKGTAAGCSGTGTYTLKNHASGNAGTYPAAANLDCTGATLFVTARSWFPTPNPGAATDTRSNTYTQIGTTVTMADGTAVDLWYSVGTGGTSFGFGYAGGIVGNFGFAAGACFTISAGTPALDQFNQTGTSNQPGSVTPTVNGALLVTGYVPDDTVTGSTLTINSGFTITDQASHGSQEGIGLAYLVQTPCAAINPTWTVSNGTKPGAANIGTFK